MIEECSYRCIRIEATMIDNSIINVSYVTSYLLNKCK